MTYLLAVFLLINAFRAHPLIETKQLDAIAQNRAEYICMTGKYSHENYQYFFAAFRPGTFVGENLAQGYGGNASAVVSAWFNSKTHRENLLDPRFHFTGLGYACGYTVQLFTV